jgi:hypothetical protein
MARPAGARKRGGEGAGVRVWFAEFAYADSQHGVMALAMIARETSAMSGSAKSD